MCLTKTYRQHRVEEWLDFAKYLRAKCVKYSRTIKSLKFDRAPKLRTWQLEAALRDEILRDEIECDGGVRLCGNASPDVALSC